MTTFLGCKARLRRSLSSPLVSSATNASATLGVIRCAVLLRDEGGEEPSGHGPPSAVLLADANSGGQTDIGTAARISGYPNVRLNLRIIRAWRWSFASGDLSRARLRLR